MDSNVIPVAEGTTIIVKASGDLFLQGENRMEVRFQSGEDRIRVNQSNNNLYVETHASLDLVVPRNAPIIVEKTGGSAFLQDLEQSVAIQKVGGDLVLRRVGSLRLEKVGGSCMIEDVNQPVVIQKIGGDLTLHHMVGSLQVGSIGGNGEIHLIGEGTLEARAGGNFTVFAEVFGGPISLRAGAGVELFLPSSVNADISLESGAESIELELENQDKVITQTIEERRHEIKVGEGGTSIEVRAGSEILVSDKIPNLRPINDEIDRRENAWKEARERRGSFSWSGGFGFDRNSAWADMISRRAQEAAQRAEHRANAAMRRTEEQIRLAAERGIRRAEARVIHGIPTPPNPPAPKVTEQERLMVLQMLRDNKITVEQAEKLLAALEGKFE